MPPPGPASKTLSDRLAAAGRRLGEREALHGQEMGRARAMAESLRETVETGLEAYHRAVDEAGASHLRVELGALRLDEKHVRAVEFDLTRGRHTAIVTVKSRGEVTLVGPFRTGKVEGPCKSFPFAAEAELESALADFLESFLEEAATP